MRLALTLFWALLSAPVSTLAAQEIQSLQSIRQAVEQAVRDEVQISGPDAKIEVGSLDTRLRLQHCEQPLDVFFPQGVRGNKLTVGVRCAEPKRWTIYVSAQIRQLAKVLVAVQHLRRGAVLQQQDFTLKEMDINRLRYGYFTDFNDVSGKRLKRHLNRGAVLTPAAIAVTKLVKRGERVTIVAETDGIAIHAAGEALEDGAMGDIIRVRNLNSKKEIEARVDGPGRVRVGL
ncbi:MAG: flagellar basal body P-ring formation protein FlgA [Gammaproteobacteria bacterium]|nr:flagellar basal body P-ring formation protein FlgA [Gammaproteobacteria bacterium]